MDFKKSVHVLKLNGHQPSNYIVEINQSTCKVCGLCVERCPRKALHLEPFPEAKNKKGMVSVIDKDRCIGCGVCAFKCPTQSLGLVHREKEQDFPRNFREQAYRMGIERGRRLPWNLQKQ